MRKNNRNYRKKELEISAIGITSERLTGRAGLALFVAYLHQIQIFPLIDRFFGSIRKNKKGVEVFELIKQVLCFMVDGTSRHLSYFDQLSKDAGYAGSIETEMQDMASSHRIKRFFNAFAWTRIFLFRRLLQSLFIWRLKIKQPKLIELGIDTMVMDNDDAKCRHGVRPTYQKKKGFQPLQMNWGRLIVDAVFRGGDKHPNHESTVQQMIRHMVTKIRKQYRPDVAIIIRTDSGFFDQKIFEFCEELKIGFVCGGKRAFDQLVDDWKGILVSDNYGVYGNWVNSRQTCLAHYIRKAKGLTEREDESISKFGESVRKQLQQLCHWAKAPPSEKQWTKFYSEFLLNLLLFDGADDGAGQLARSLLREMDSLWVFLEENGVEPTNNRAERALRFGFIWRKRSNGTQSDKGNRWVERILSIKQTCRKLAVVVTTGIGRGVPGLEEASNQIAHALRLEGMDVFGQLKVGGNPECMVCGYGESCPMSALPFIFGDDTKVTPEKFCKVKAQTETWEQAKTLGKEIAQKLGEQMRM